MTTNQQTALMRRALELAAHGQGAVEPNPLVGCVIARDAEILAEGWHSTYGGDHAEVAAIRNLRGDANGATLYVTLEPCCHQGKTPPCTRAILQAGIRQVVVAMRDPFPQVAGGGIAELRAAGVQVAVGLLEKEAAWLNAPYLTRLSLHRPWIIAKWAMTLDGKIATRTKDSRWISSEASRAIGQALRGRVDGVAVGIGTALADDPLLIAKPGGPRTATRIVMDRQARLPLSSQLVETIHAAPLLLAVGPTAPAESCRLLEEAGCHLLRVAGDDQQCWQELLAALAREGMTNILVEGGGRVLGSLFDAELIDEVHVFVAPIIAGGAQAQRL